MTENITAIILKRTDYRESDLEVTMMSEERGRLRAIAIGAKKIKSKLAGHLEPFREVRMMLAKGKTLDKIGQVVTLNNFGVQRANAEALTRAQKAADWIIRLAPEHQREQEMYVLCRDFFEHNFDSSASAGVLSIFMWRMLMLAGFAPETAFCMECGEQRKDSEEYLFSLKRGGILCAKCDGQREETAIKISKEAVQALSTLEGSVVSEETAMELESLAEKFLEYHV